MLLGINRMHCKTTLTQTLRSNKLKTIYLKFYTRTISNTFHALVMRVTTAAKGHEICLFIPCTTVLDWQMKNKSIPFYYEKVYVLN